MGGPSHNDPASTLLLSYAYEQVQAIMDWGRRARQDESDSVHGMRIATRRLSAALSTYRKLLDPGAVAHLRRELKWLAGALGPARDAQVMHTRLRRLLDEEPAELVIGPISLRVDEALEADFEAAQREVVSALGSDRYARLLDALATLLADPPLTPRASRPAHKTIPALVDKSRRRLRRAVEVTSGTEGPERDAALHEVRKCAKRLRYASEVATPIRPKRAVRLAHAAHDLQRILGDHHDSVVARDLLLGLGAEARRRGESDFTYGRLHALESDHAAESDARFLEAWKGFPTTSLSH
jgi:CHAD domain-containing protein